MFPLGFQRRQLHHEVLPAHRPRFLGIELDGDILGPSIIHAFAHRVERFDPTLPQLTFAAEHSL